MQTVKYPQVTVQLTGTDGNDFSIIAAVRSALSQEVSANAASEFTVSAMDCSSYDEMLRYAKNTVNVL